MSGQRTIEPGAVSLAPGTSDGAAVSRAPGDRHAGAQPEPPQRDFNRELAVAVRAALAGRQRDSGHFAPELDPLISHYGAKSGTSVEPADAPEVTLAPVSDPLRETASEPANSQPDAGEAPFDARIALQSLLSRTQSPASGIASGAQAASALGQTSPNPCATGGTSQSAPSPSLRLPRAGGRAQFLLTIDNTIEAADKVMGIADAAMRAVDDRPASDVTTTTPHDRPVHAPHGFNSRPVLILATLLGAALVLLVPFEPRSLGFGTGVPTGDTEYGPSSLSLVEARFEKPAVPGTPADAEEAAALPAVKDPAAKEPPSNELPINKAPAEGARTPTGSTALADLVPQGNEGRRTSTLESEAAVAPPELPTVAPLPRALGAGAAEVPGVAAPEPSAGEKNAGDPETVAAIPGPPSPAEKPAQMVSPDPGTLRMPTTTGITAGAAISEPVTAGRSPISADETRGLRERAEALLSTGDIAAARLLLQRAAQARDARACLLLGATYDPMVLERLGIRGVTADPVLARTWYEQAKALGSEDASKRLDVLAQWMSADRPVSDPH